MKTKSIFLLIIFLFVHYIAYMYVKSKFDDKVKQDLKLQPLRMVVDSRYEKLAVYGIDQKVKVFNTKSKAEVNKDFFANKL